VDINYKIHDDTNVHLNKMVNQQKIVNVAWPAHRWNTRLHRLTGRIGQIPPRTYSPHVFKGQSSFLFVSGWSAFENWRGMLPRGTVRGGTSSSVWPGYHSKRRRWIITVRWRWKTDNMIGDRRARRPARCTAETRRMKINAGRKKHRWHWRQFHTRFTLQSVSAAVVAVCF